MKNIFLFPFVLIAMIVMIVYAWWPEDVSTISNNQ
jgi:hypothetical protein